MSSRSTVAVSFVALAFFGDGLLADDYLTKDGQLTHPLKAIQLQGGFAGYTGMQFTIAPDGSWTAHSVFNEKKTLKENGKLTAKELAQLGMTLQKYDLAKLPEKSGKQPGANPRTVAFEFGKRKATWVGQVPPKLDPRTPESVESRFAGIWEAVEGLLMSPKKSEKNEP